MCLCLLPIFGLSCSFARGIFKQVDPQTNENKSSTALPQQKEQQTVKPPSAASILNSLRQLALNKDAEPIALFPGP